MGIKLRTLNSEGSLPSESQLWFWVCIYCRSDVFSLSCPVRRYLMSTLPSWRQWFQSLAEDPTSLLCICLPSGVTAGTAWLCWWWHFPLWLVSSGMLTELSAQVDSYRCHGTGSLQRHILKAGLNQGVPPVTALLSVCNPHGGWCPILWVCNPENGAWFSLCVCIIYVERCLILCVYNPHGVWCLILCVCNLCGVWCLILCHSLERS